MCPALGAQRVDVTKLAVKVQRPTVQRDVSGDIRLTCAAIRAIRALGLKVFDWMLEPMSEFVASTREELDFRIEDSCMRQHRLNSRDNPRERIPEVLDRFRAHLPSPPRVPIISY
jgi:predicted unusual protein kinase regulating ubiquinone biosynthesis (AarF/ABC1/UbiB family)